MRQRFVADSGRVSTQRRTRSPIPAAFCSSWAFSLLVRRMTLPYRACSTRSSTATTTVLSILSLTTSNPHGSCGIRAPQWCSRSRCSGSSGALHRFDAQLALTHQVQYLRDVLADGLEPTVVLELTGRRLEAEVDSSSLASRSFASSSRHPVRAARTPWYRLTSRFTCLALDDPALHRQLVGLRERGPHGPSSRWAGQFQHYPLGARSRSTTPANPYRNPCGVSRRAFASGLSDVVS